MKLPARTPVVTDSLPALVALETLTPAQILHAGELANSIHVLHAQGLPTPTSWLLTTDALTTIAERSGLARKLELLFSTARPDDDAQMQRFSVDITQQIKHLSLPTFILEEFRSIYDSWLNHQFVAIRPSFLSSHATSTKMSALHVQGEANIIESLFKVWARLYSPALLPERIGEWKKGLATPVALVIQIMVNAESSGVALFLPPSKKKAAHITVFSQWGITPSAQEVFSQGDWYEVSPQSWQIVQKKTSVKRTEWVRSLDELHRQPVSKTLATHPSLTPQGAIAIARMVEKARKGQFGAIAVDWAAERSRAFILDIRPFEPPTNEMDNLYFLPTAEQLHTLSTQRTAPPINKSTRTRILASIGKLTPHDDTLSHADGVGLLRSEWAYQQLDHHPIALIQQGKGEYVRRALCDLLLSVAQHHSPDFSILLRSHNFTTNELASLPGGTRLEASEINPYLGYRGAVRIIHDYRLFDVELDALLDAYQHGLRHLGLLIPFVRSHSELAILIHHFAKPEFETHRFLKLWMQANTPENLVGIQSYCQPGLHGISINIKSIHALFHGIDPDHPDLFHLYPLDHHQLRPLLAKAREHTQAHHIQLTIHLEEYSQHLIEFASELGYDGITVRTKDIHRARQGVYANDSTHPSQRNS